MVVFTCNNCGESLKKSQVEKHAMTSRHCRAFSCMDCCQDFSMESYKLHTSCVSEAQRYQGALYDGPGDGETKGVRKQKEWIEQVKQSVNSASNLSPRVSTLLSTVSEYPNVPRKQKKFENFVRNSLRERNPKTIQEVWEAFSGQTKEKQIVSEQESVDVPTHGAALSPARVESDPEETRVEEETQPKEKKKKKKRNEIEIEESAQPEDNVNADVINSQDVGEEEFEIKSKHKKKKRLNKEIELDNDLVYPDANDFIENQADSLDINSKKLKLEVTEKKHKKKKKYKIVEIDI